MEDFAYFRSLDGNTFFVSEPFVCMREHSFTTSAIACEQGAEPGVRHSS